MRREPLLDSQLGIETPEGVVLALRPAGLVPRFCAAAIDMVIRAVIYAVLGTTLIFAREMGVGIFLVLLFLLEWFYHVIFEVWRRGATPGKRVMGLVVVEDNGLPVSLGASVVRNLLRAVDFMPFFYGAGVVSLLLTRDFKRLGDLVAGTRVVYADAGSRRRQLPDAMPQAPRSMPDLEVQQALIGLAERAPRLTHERLAELTRMADEVMNLPPVPNPEQRLFAHAGWLLGRRTTPGDKR